MAVRLFSTTSSILGGVCADAAMLIATTNAARRNPVRLRRMILFSLR
jgi:hypothetical protein